MAKQEIQKEKKREPRLNEGRPTKYNQEMADKICEIVSITPSGLRRICDTNKGFPTSDTILLWRRKHPEFSSQYKLAKEQQAELFAEQIIEIADDDSKDISFDINGNEKINSEFVNRSRIRIDARKWHAAKLLPRIYGDRVQTDSTVIIRHEDELKELE